MIIYNHLFYFPIPSFLLFLVQKMTSFLIILFLNRSKLFCSGFIDFSNLILIVLSRELSLLDSFLEVQRTDICDIKVSFIMPKKLRSLLFVSWPSSIFIKDSCCISLNFYSCKAWEHFIIIGNYPSWPSIEMRILWDLSFEIFVPYKKLCSFCLSWSLFSWRYLTVQRKKDLMILVYQLLLFWGELDLPQGSLRFLL
mgnify:CR=1 FL=1